MGLNISGNIVEVDHSHNQLMNTSTEGNPKIESLKTEVGNIDVYSCFQRHKAPNSSKRDRSSRKVGDNCHLLYALKGKDDLVTTMSSIKSLLPNFNIILGKIGQIAGEFDLVIPMPSGHRVSDIYAKRLGNTFGAVVNAGMFRKISALEAQDLLHNAQLTSSEKSKIRAKLNSDAFSLKNIPVQFRKHFPPVALQANSFHIEQIQQSSRILLVDDLLATGTTIITAKKLLENINPSASIEASCLFSSV